MFALANLMNPTYNYGYKGFTSIVTQFIDIAKSHHEEYNDYKVFVDDPQMLDVFENLYVPQQGDEFYLAGDVFLKKFDDDKVDKRYNAHTLANVDDLRRRKEVFDSILRFKPEVLSNFESKRNSLIGDKVTLGVHVRGTDKGSEISPPSVENIISHINVILKNDSSIESIFLATDDIRYLVPIANEFRHMIVFDSNKEISRDGWSLHHRGLFRKILNQQVLEDVYFLSKVKHFLYSFSNVSQLALIMGVDHHQMRTNLNSQSNSY